TENFGSLKVADTVNGKPLTKVYVKVYAKLADGSVKFHKDGYTDLRGRFDYASVNTPERQAIQRFAVLILSDDHGAGRSSESFRNGLLRQRLAGEIGKRFPTPYRLIAG